jgi:flagellar hook protein FlgE
MASFSIPLTGLNADATALNTIGNNLANLNTTAFKEQSTSFEDLFYQQIGTSGANNPLLSGVGTRVAGTATDFSQGALATSGNATDIAIQGNGFFVLEQNGVQELTRAGSFQLDATGNLITQDGQKVMGFGASNGVLSTNNSLTGITIPVGMTQAAQATGNFSLTANLDSSSTVGTSFNSSLSLYDSLGVSHNATVTFTKTGANTWGYAVALPAGDATGTPVNNTGTLTFDTNGNLLTPAANISNITFPGMADGASDMNFAWNLYNASTGGAMVGQSSASSAVSLSTQDGYASGSYESFAVDAQGVIAAKFNNGQTQDVGQLALALVANQQGLMRLGGNNYGVTNASGFANVGVAGVGGLGTIEGNSLEQSNVDISTEFSNLIVAQRAFEANSKTVTTFDTVTQDTINLIR